MLKTLYVSFLHEEVIIISSYVPWLMQTTSGKDSAYLSKQIDFSESY